LVAIACLTIIAAIPNWIQSSREKSLQSATLAELKASLTAMPDNERALYYLGQKQEALGDMHAAMDAYWRALQVNQQDEAAWLGWARTTDAVLGPDKAKQVIQTCLQALPNSAPAYVELAKIEQRLGDHASARAAAERAAMLDRRSVEAWKIAGAEAAALKRHEDARRAFAAAAGLSAQDWRIQAGLGDALSHLGRRQEAIGAFRVATRLAPNEGVTHLLLGTELLLAASSDVDIESARTELLATDRLDPSLPPPARFQKALMIGDSYRRQRRYRQALPWYAKAEALSPFDPTVPYELVRVYRAIGDPAAAKRAEARHEALSRIDRDINVLALRVDLAPDDHVARLKLARLYSSVGQPDKAAIHYRRLMTSSPSAELARRELSAMLAQPGSAGR
jgi:tetratricopeptide (TPR) repeat protein